MDVTSPGIVCLYVTDVRESTDSLITIIMVASVLCYNYICVIAPIFKVEMSSYFYQARPPHTLSQGEHRDGRGS